MESPPRAQARSNSRRRSRRSPSYNSRRESKGAQARGGSRPRTATEERILDEQRESRNSSFWRPKSYAAPVGPESEASLDAASGGTNTSRPVEAAFNYPGARAVRRGVPTAVEVVNSDDTISSICRMWNTSACLGKHIRHGEEVKCRNKHVCQNCLGADTQCLGSWDCKADLSFCEEANTRNDTRLRAIRADIR
jgi:hypothetical protein